MWYLKVGLGKVNARIGSDEHVLLLVLAALVLEPDTNDARVETGHLDQLLLHDRVRPRIGTVACAQHVQLLLVEHGANARWLAATATATATAAASTVHIVSEARVLAAAAQMHQARRQSHAMRRHLMLLLLRVGEWLVMVLVQVGGGGNRRGRRAVVQCLGVLVAGRGDARLLVTGRFVRLLVRLFARRVRCGRLLGALLLLSRRRRCVDLSSSVAAVAEQTADAFVEVALVDH